VANTTFIFETSPNTKPKEKKVGGTWHIMSPPSEKVGGHVPRVPHQIAPMHVTINIEWLLKIILSDICINIENKQHVNIFLSSIPNLKCTPSDRQMYPRLGTPVLVGFIHQRSFPAEGVQISLLQPGQTFPAQRLRRRVFSLIVQLCSVSTTTLN